MNNPYSQNPQQSGRNHWNENQRSGPQGDAWNTDEYRSARPTWRGENPNRAHNRSPWSNQDSYSQSRYSPNFDAMSGGYGEYDWEGGRDRGYSGDRNYNSSGRDDYAGRNDFGSRGDYSNRDAYGYYGSDMQGQGGASPWMTSDDYGSGNYGSRNFGRPNYDASANYIGADRGAAHYSSRQNFATSSNPVRAFFDTGEPPRWSDHSQRWGEQPRSASNHRDSGNFGYRGDAHSRGSSNFSAFGESDQFESNRGAYGLQRGHKGTGPKGYVRSDERICEDICEKLSNDPRIDASETSVQVRDGVVTLEGSVSQRWQKHCIEDLADNCSGVKDVHNNLRVAQNERGENAHAASGQASPAMNATTSPKTGTSSPTTSETQAGSKSSKS